jgi:hypothetical protein
LAKQSSSFYIIWIFGQAKLFVFTTFANQGFVWPKSQKLSQNNTSYFFGNWLAMGSPGPMLSENRYNTMV